jgi:hypothetical protein
MLRIALSSTLEAKSMRLRPRSAGTVAAAVLLLGGFCVGIAAATHGGDVHVSNGSPPSPFSQNKQNEPAVAVDAAHPNVLAAGSNDNIDMEACNAGDPMTCPFTDRVGVSGIYFSFDSGDTWTQPTYQGTTGRDCLGPAECVAHPGPIGTLPHYAEHGLVSDGDPALAFGPKRGSNGRFSWGNGSRLYYANLTSADSGAPEAAFKGFEALAVSRTDDPQSAAAGNASAWRDPVIISKQSSTTFSDKEQIWADNATTSRYFGNVYVCWASFRSNSHGNAYPVPLQVARSTDGGDTWSVKQISPATSNSQSAQPDGCTVRTDSAGAVYVFGLGTPNGSKTTGQVLYKSTDGGASYGKPQFVKPAVRPGVIDPVLGRPVMDGIAGARIDLAAAPSVDIANGAPSGAGATNQIVMSWGDGRDGLNNEHALFTTSRDRGKTWSATRVVETQASDRPFYTAPAISPTGTDVYLVYNAFTTPYRADTTSPRMMVGVVLHADVSSTGDVGAFTVLHRGTPGDPRGSSQNNLDGEFLGDYVYAAATRTYGVAVWNDTRNADDCPAVDAYHADQRDGGTDATRPSPGVQCAPRFGNTDIFGGSYADPTP